MAASILSGPAAFTLPLCDCLPVSRIQTSDSSLLVASELGSVQHEATEEHMAFNGLVLPQRPSIQ